MPGGIVATRSGRLEGRKGRGLEIFRGVPYARPPLGELRFRAPQPPEPWQGVRPALRFGEAAPQSSPLPILPLRMIGAGASAQREDCLYLNVWTPAADSKRRPVMVWIHGGAFVMGSGSISLWDGARLARRGDVVVVTLNYRLGALGYLDLRGFSGLEGTPANLGLRDQIAALQWVRDNIEAFGGDPDNVTIFGESAGAMSVATLLGTPAARGLFRRAIAQSGAADHVSSAEAAAGVAELFLRELGDSAQNLSALRATPLESILRAQRAVMLPSFRTGKLPWQPSIDGDVLPQSPLRTIEMGLSRSVSLLVGTNRDEFKFFTLGDRKALRMSEEALRRRLARLLPGKDADGTPLAEAALEIYGAGGTRRGPASPGERWVAFQSDRIFHCPATRLAERHALSAAQTYTYLFTWSLPLLRNRLGAFHGLEIPFVFGTLRDPLLRASLGASRSALGLSDRMQDAWIAFARCGDPSHADLPDWARYEAKRRSTMVFGADCREESSRFEDVTRFWDRCATAGEVPTAVARA
jgi:para-nitrobenzyl esterase